jgi:uncharacterized protein (DUF983 family)
VTVYREGGEAPCYKCDRTTGEVCATCQQPTCERHLDPRKQCGRCDEAYYRYMRSDDGGMVMVALPVVVIASLVFGLLSAAFLPVAIGIPIIGFPILVVARKRRRRAKFFRMMRARGALPEARTVDPADAEAARLVAKLEKGLRKRK